MSLENQHFYMVAPMAKNIQATNNTMNWADIAAQNFGGSENLGNIDRASFSNPMYARPVNGYLR